MTYAETLEEARKLARLLGERKHSVAGQIRRIIHLCGIDFARDIYTATVQVEDNGGMMLPDNSRRRTRGGVFFQLVQAKLNETQQKKVPRRGVKPRFHLLTWKKRIELIESLQAGQVKSLTGTLSGRPEQVEKRTDVVVVSLTDMQIIDNLPRGLPLPPPMPTVVTVYIAPEQWQKVEAALTKPSNKLLVEGTFVFDPETKSMMVFATSVKIAVIKTQLQKAADKPEKTKNKA